MRWIEITNDEFAPRFSKNYEETVSQIKKDWDWQKVVIEEQKKQKQS